MESLPSAHLADDLFSHALGLHQEGRLERAELLYAHIVETDPHHSRALNNLGILLWQAGQPDRAITCLQRVVALAPEHLDAQLNLARLLQGQGRLDAALQPIQQVLARQPGHPEAGLIRAQVLLSAGRWSDALTAFDVVLTAHPGHLQAWSQRGLPLHAMGRYDEAIASFDVALRLDGLDADTHLYKALSEHCAGRLEAAISSCTSALRIHPHSLQARMALGVSCLDLDRFAEALEQFECALEIDPDDPEAWACAAAALESMGRSADAVQRYGRSLQLDPQRPDSLVGLAQSLCALQRMDEAAACLERALMWHPDHAPAHLAMGMVMGTLGQDGRAIACYKRVLELDPHHAVAMNNLGFRLTKIRECAQALDVFKSLVRIEPDFAFAKGALLHAKMTCCEWDGLADLHACIRSELHAGALSAEPYGFLAISESERDIHACTTIYARHKRLDGSDARWAATHDHDRVRVGYLCGEFREQATSILMAGLWEHHDRARFETFAFDNGGSDMSARRARIERAFDHLFDIRDLSDARVADVIRSHEIDILVNLNGYFGSGRPRVFALRPSPVQVNYLGFPGTIGARCIDYIIADAVVIPPASRGHYTEKVVCLPPSYQANDALRPLPQAQPPRAALGLPERGFIFCCFNNSFKITPEVFASWMRILNRVPDSVLWLIHDNPLAVRNLRQQAALQAVDPARLVFAGRVDLAQHLARHAVADLFLDTSPYNAHTTASDCLWVGVPLLTRVGSTFPGRVAASLLQALDMPELVTQTIAEYEARAVELATNRDRLSSIRSRLQERRTTAPLFDTEGFARRFEAALLAMHERRRRGMGPDHLNVPA